jgi:hypothetical protein
MATLELRDIADRLINSIEQLQQGVWFDEMQNSQDYPLANMARGSIGKEATGNQLAWRIGVGSTRVDGHHGLYEDFDLDRPDAMVKATAVWRFARQGTAIDMKEIDEGAVEQVIDDLETLRNNMWVHMVEDFENGAWQVPGTGNALMENGIPYYVVWNGTDGLTGVGSNASGDTVNVAGISTTTQTKWRNYAFTYTTANYDDLGKLLLSYIRQARWRPPVNVKGNTQMNRVIAMDVTTLNEWETVARSQNDQLGPDPLTMMDRSLLARTAPKWFPQLDDNAASGSNPVYVLNMDHLFPCFKRGWKFRELPPREQPKQRTAIGWEVHAAYNWKCTSRRRQIVGAKAEPFNDV